MAVLAIVKLIGYAGLARTDGLTLDSAILVDTIAFGVAYAFMFRAYRRNTPASARGYRPEGRERRRLLRYGLFNNFNDAGTLALNVKSDNFFIAAILDPLSVGIYAFYTRLNDMVQQLLPVRLFQNVVQPLLFAVPRTEADGRIPGYFSLLVNLNLVLQWPVLAFATAYHHEIVQVVFGGKFVADSWLLPLIVGFATLNAIEFPVTFVAQYEEKAGIILTSKLFGIYNVVALLLLLPALGVAGAAIATGSAQTMKNAFIWWHVRGRARWANALPAILSSVALWGGAVALCWMLKDRSQLPVWLDLLVGAAVVGGCAMLHLRGPAVSEADRRILASVLAGREATLLRLAGLLPRGTTVRSAH
jgi:O-antigen/teichoic acid export membrane protein